MKLYAMLIFVIVLFCQSCDTEDDLIPTCENCTFTCIRVGDTAVFSNICMANWDCQFNVLPNARIKIEETEGVAEGANTVFQMMNSTLGSAIIADDEVTTVLVFELDNSKTSFTAEGEELQLLNMHFNRICYCVERGFVPVKVGCVQGEKQPDGQWFVQGSVIASYSYGDLTVKFDARFTE